MDKPMPLPLDIKLMNLAASLLFALALLLLLAAAVWAGLSHSLFSLRGITVQGDVAHNNAVTLRANVASRLSGNFFTMDLHKTSSVFESVPWVRTAVVRREFPNRLRVTLFEHQAAAFWGDDAESRMVNTFGEVFDANTDEVEADELPRLHGPEGQAAQVLTMYRLLSPDLARLDSHVDELALSSRGSWQAHLDNGAVIEIGRGGADELRARVLRFVGTLAQVASRYGRRNGQDLEYADLRHGDGYALRLRGISTMAAASGADHP
jgi:cell division protein FtsQ